MVKYKYKRFSFSGNLGEKAYLLGLRTGDIHARQKYRTITVETTSPKRAQIKMFDECFSKYGKVISYEKRGGATAKTTRVYCSLDESFSFLLEKPQSIPLWILENNDLFYSFLTGYADSEGSWIITEHKKYNGKYKDLVLSIGTCDKIILEQIHQKLKELGFNSHFYLVRKKGTYTGVGFCNLDLYRVMMMRIKDVIKLTKILLPLSKHEDKKSKMSEIIKLEPTFKRAASLEISCPSCGYNKLWKEGHTDRRTKKFRKFVCSKCRHYFSESNLIKLVNAGKISLKVAGNEKLLLNFELDWLRRSKV